jgi:glycosyltransferase involved in cell wall biosynthesis
VKKTKPLCEIKQMEQMISISVIVPVKNGEDTLEECLKALTHQKGYVFQEQYEIIVVDDGSVDSTAAIAARWGTTVIKQKNAGPASARNHGARLARGMLLVFTDADCAPSSNWLEEITTPFNDPAVIGVKGSYLTHQNNPISQFVQGEYEYKYERMKKYSQIDFIDTYSAAYRKEIFLDNGGFNEYFTKPSVEDQEFSFRLAKKGYRMVFAPKAEVYHHHDTTIIEYGVRKYGIGYWKMAMLRWMPERASGDTHTPPSQSVQIAFLGAAIILAVAGILWPPTGWIALFFMAVFYFSALPFLGFIWRRNWKIAIVAMFLLLIRAFTLGMGMVSCVLIPPKSK